MIERSVLERPTSLHQAERILDEFLTDTIKYPDDDFYMRRGICKVLADEYHPLVRLAQTLHGVRCIKLSSSHMPVQMPRQLSGGVSL